MEQRRATNTRVPRVYGRLLLVLIDRVLQVEMLVGSPRRPLLASLCRRKKNNGEGRNNLRRVVRGLERALVNPRDSRVVDLHL